MVIHRITTMGISEIIRRLWTDESEPHSGDCPFPATATPAALKRN